MLCNILVPMNYIMKKTKLKFESSEGSWGTALIKIPKIMMKLIGISKINIILIFH